MRLGARIYALGTATWLLAEAGILHEQRCTIHWAYSAALRETFKDLDIDEVLFVRSGQISTCAGGAAAFDLAIDMVKHQAGERLARTVCRFVTADRWRDGAVCQSVPPGLRLGEASKKLLPIIKLMESHLEDPMRLTDISRCVGLSCRQMERLFERHLSSSPRQYYLDLRLDRAMQLVDLMDMPIADIAIACGFESPSHFSKAFRVKFGRLPSHIRRPSRA